jgi:dihydroorotase
VLYKCGWSPLEGSTFPGGVTRTVVNGQTVYTESDGVLNLDSSPAMRLSFDR